MLSKSLLFYAVLAVVIAAIAYFALYSILYSSYNVNVELYNTNITGLFPYSTSRFEVVVQNNGSSYIKSMLVAFYLNGQAIHTQSVSLPPHTNASMVYNYTYISNGTYQFEAIADPAHTLKVSDLQNTQRSVTAYVGNTIAPAPFSSIPNSSIESSYAFGFTNGLFPVIASIDGNYNITFINQVFSPSNTVLQTVASKLDDLVVNSYGAYAKYDNGSTAQAIWMQQLAGVQYIDELVSSFGFSEKTVPITNGSAEVFALGNSTSMCVYASGGWTDIVTYHSVTNGTCASFLSVDHGQSAAYALGGRINSTRDFVNYTGHLTYTNATYLGTLFGADSNSVYFSDAFETANFLFFGYLNDTANANVMKNETCYGLLSNSSYVCSVEVPSVSAAFAGSYTVVDSRAFAGNYAFNLYSVVNQSDAEAAHISAVGLVDALNLSGAKLIWNSPYKNSCNLNSTKISCTFEDYFSANDTAVMELHNNMSSGIRITSASCYGIGVPYNYTENLTIGALRSANLSVACSTLQLSAFGAQSSYTIKLKYASGNTVSAVNGTFNVSNFV